MIQWNQNTISERIRYISLNHSLGLCSVVIQLPHHMKTGHKPNEAETHYKNNSWGDLQSRSVVSVEPQHVAVPTSV